VGGGDGGVGVAGGVLMAALGTTVSLAKLGGGNVWHFTDGEAGDGVEVKALCGRAGALGDYQQDVDANVIRHQGAKVCADCKTIIDAGGSPQNGGNMSTTTAEKSKSGAADTVTSDALKKAIARAEKAIASQPKRTEVDLTQAKADKAFTLGKSIADRGPGGGAQQDPPGEVNPALGG
jgi:hypothetical protein